MHKYHGIVTASGLSRFPVGTWVTVEADGVEVTLPSGVSVVRGATSHAVLDTDVGEGVTLSKRFTYGLARSITGQVQLVGHISSEVDAELILVLDTSGYYDNHLRLAGGDLQVRGADADRIRKALASGEVDHMTECALTELLFVHGQEERNPVGFDLAYMGYRKVGGWKKCQISA